VRNYLIANPRRYKADFIAAVSDCGQGVANAKQGLAALTQDYALDAEAQQDVSSWIAYCAPRPPVGKTANSGDGPGVSVSAITSLPTVSSAAPDKLNPTRLHRMNALVLNTSYSGDDYEERHGVPTAEECSRLCMVQAQTERAASPTRPRLRFCRQNHEPVGRSQPREPTRSTQRPQSARCRNHFVACRHPGAGAAPRLTARLPFRSGPGPGILPKSGRNTSCCKSGAERDILPRENSRHFERTEFRATGSVRAGRGNCSCGHYIGSVRLSIRRCQWTQDSLSLYSLRLLPRWYCRCL
jgi:hypothetical protein